MHNLFEMVIAQDWRSYGLTPPHPDSTPGSCAMFAVTQLFVQVLLPRTILFAAAISILLIVFSRNTSSTSPAATSKALGGTILVVMLLLSDTLTPLLALCFIIQATALTALVLIPLKKKQAQGITSVACEAASIAALYALMQSQAFFVTGHLCEFAGLQYTAGFVGYEEFNLLRSGALVAIDSFGGMVLLTLGLVLAATLLDKALASGLTDEKSGESNQENNKPKNTETKSAARSTLGSIILLYGTARGAACLCATISAGIQRRHLYAWALFAPKFAFEVLFLACTDVVLLWIGAWTE